MGRNRSKKNGRAFPLNQSLIHLLFGAIALINLLLLVGLSDFFGARIYSFISQSKSWEIYYGLRYSYLHGN